MSAASIASGAAINGAHLQDEISLREWHTSLRTAVRVSSELMQRMNRKAIKIYGVNHDPMLAQEASSNSRPNSARANARNALARASSLDSQHQQ